MVLVVSSKNPSGNDINCKAGHGIQPTYVLTSGSQCIGISKITTEAECIAAAEYNKKNGIDGNTGYGGPIKKNSPGVSFNPPGCFMLAVENKYRFNSNTKSIAKCSNDAKCICKPKTCTKCLSNTYSEGGTNPT